MPTKEQIIQEFKKEFPHVYEWTDAPNTTYPSHTHKGRVTIFIVEGALLMNMDGIHYTLRKGDRFNVPVGQPHTGKVGLDGCTFIVGEEIEGDS